MQWICTAHEAGLLGADGSGDECFMEDAVGRCKNRRQCQSRVRRARKKLQTQLDDLAEDGTPIFAEVASEMPLPEQMLTSVAGEQAPVD